MIRSISRAQHAITTSSREHGWEGENESVCLIG